MDKITVRKYDKAEYDKCGIAKWPIWEKEVSRFDWSYDTKETCYILEGEAVVTPEKGNPVNFGAGDMVIFPEGMKCVWDIKADIKKHYKFGS